MYLGSNVNIATIVHEFGHVIDRSVHFTDYLSETLPPAGISRLASNAGLYGINLDQTLHLAIQGFAAKQYYSEEFWADLFMTAVLDPLVSGETYQVYSILPAAMDDFVELFAAAPEGENVFFDCRGDGEEVVCDYRDVMWRRFGTGEGELTGNASAVMKRLQELIPNRLAINSGDATDEQDQGGL